MVQGPESWRWLVVNGKGKGKTTDNLAFVCHPEDVLDVQYNSVGKPSSVCHL